MSSKNEKKNVKNNDQKSVDLIPLIEYEDLMDTTDVCNLLKIKVDTLYKWVESGIIPHYRITGKKILFNRKKLSQWIVSKEVS